MSKTKLANAARRTLNDAAARAGEEYRKRTGKTGKARQFAKYTPEAKDQALSEAEVNAYQDLLTRPTYAQLERIFYAYVVFAIGQALIFCIDTVFGTNIKNDFIRFIEFASMLFGIVLTAFYIHATYKGLKFGVFQGWQKMFAQLTFCIAFVDESLAILAKFNPDIAPLYRQYVLPLSAPGMAFFSIMLVLTEPNARQFRKERIAEKNTEHQASLLRIQKKTEKINAVRRERWVRGVAVKMHSAKLYVRTVWHSIWNGYAMTQAGKQGLNLVKDVVKSNKFHVEPASGDGQSTNPDDIVVTAGKS